MKIKCHWCGKKNRTASNWEQMSVTRGWLALCIKCANRRLKNPYNALLEIRECLKNK